jgi:hypothetical protein
MRAGHRRNSFGTLYAGKQNEIFDRVLIGALCARIANVSEPLNLGRNLAQGLKLGRRKEPVLKAYFDGRLKPISLAHLNLDGLLSRTTVSVPSTARSEWQLPSWLVDENRRLGHVIAAD